MLYVDKNLDDVDLLDIFQYALKNHTNVTDILPSNSDIMNFSLVLESFIYTKDFNFLDSTSDTVTIEKPLEFWEHINGTRTYRGILEALGLTKFTYRGQTLDLQIQELKATHVDIDEVKEFAGWGV